MANTIDVRLEGVPEMLSALKAYQVQKRGAAMRALDASAMHLVRNTKLKLSQEGGGRTYRRGTVTHVASAPGQPPAVDTGRLRSSIRTLKPNPGPLTRSVGTNVEYAPHLEHGTRTMAARPFLGPAALEERANLVKELTEALR